MTSATKAVLAACAALAWQTVAQEPRERVLDQVLNAPEYADAPAADGRPVFDKVCAACHTFGSIGKAVGPDLTTLASRLKKKEALEAILWPSRAIADEYRTVLIEKRDGDIVGGMVQREDAVRVVLVTAGALDKPITVLKSQIQVRQPSATSLMPEDLLGEFTTRQVASLMTFLFSPPPR